MATDAEVTSAISAQFVAGKNKIINGDFGIWQRGTSFTVAATNVYTADRWQTNRNGSGATITVSQQTFTPGAAPDAGYEGQNFIRIAQSVAGTGGSFNILQQRIENVRTFAGQTVTLSFWAKADAARTVAVNFYQSFGSGGSGDVSVTAQNASVTTAWQRFTLTYAIPSVSGKTIGASSFLALRFTQPGGVTMTLDYWGVQVEQGSTATAFQTATGTIQGELAACQRYFQTMGAYQQFGSFYLNTAAMFTTSLPVVMRTTPTITYNATFTNAVDVPGVGLRTPTGYTSWGLRDVSFAFLATGMGVTTIYSPAAYIGGNHQLSAEL
jgi:hypothetical protein